MSNKIQIRRGIQAGLPTGDPGEPLLATDSGRVFMGNTTGNIELKTIAVGAQTIYVTTLAKGGDTKLNGRTGLALKTGTATSTTANDLVDSAASFTSALVGRAVRNTTDDTWAKVNAYVSPTQLTLSVDIMISGEGYVVSDAISNIADAFSSIKEGYTSEVTVRISNDVFSGNANFIGKLAADDVTITLQGSTSGTTTLSGNITCRQRMTWKNITFTGSIKTYFGSDLTWNTCVTSGLSRLFIYAGAINSFVSCTVTVGNDPTGITQISSTITKGYTLYVATAALGGSDAVADGLAITSGTATGTTASKLVDSAANFTSAVLDKTVWNSTDDTWAKITVVDSATQLSLSADIMVSGEAYVIANAFATIQGGFNAIPGAVNCDTSIKISAGTFTEDVAAQGKTFAGPYRITLKGTLTLLDSLTASAGTKGTGVTRASVTRSAGTWALANERQHKLLKFTSGNNIGVSRLIDSNSITVATLIGTWTGTITSGDTFVVQDWATIIQASVGKALILTGQTSFYLENLALYKQGTSWAIELYSNSALTLTRCSIQGYACQEPGTLSTYDVINMGGTLATFLQQATFFGYRTKITGYSYCIQALAMSNVQIRDGSIINAGSVYGVWLDRNSVGRFDVAGSDVYNLITGCATGIYAAFGGKGKFTSTVQYSGNTANETADAVTYGYID